MAQLNPLVAFFFSLCLLVPLVYSKSIDVRYCDKNADYAVKVSGVEISPYPVSRGKKTTFSIAAYADKVISGGKLKIDVSYFGFHVHNENHKLCKETLCPVSVGEFVLSHTLKLPGITPPGSYTLRMTMEDEDKKQLTCITFGFSIGFVAQQAFSDL